MSAGREPLQIVEIDMDRCSRTYGSSPCTAALSATNVRKCYNTFHTCQDTTNYDQGTVTLRFAKNQSGLPLGEWLYPALQSASTNPLAINPRGDDGRTGPLGKRARITVNFLDFPDSDRRTDPYVEGRRDGTAQNDESGYEPRDRGTFFGKMRRRWPHYVGRSLRVKDGYVGDDIASMDTRHYVISEWKGPDDSGKVVITAKDILDLADNEKALCPSPSNGTLSDDMTADELVEFTIQPVGIGDTEYEASGRASIGREIVTYTRTADVITLTARGVDGSTASTHRSGDTFQVCARWEDEDIATVARDLLRDYAGIDTSFIPFSDWSDETERWLAGFQLTRTIPRPLGVTKLLGELAALGPVWWWDDRDQEIKMRAARPVDQTETKESFTDDTSIVAKLSKIENLDGSRISQVLLYHGLTDFAQSVTDAENYARVNVSFDAETERDEAHGQPSIYTIHSPWLGVGNGSAANAIASRMLNRYKETPVKVTFSLDVKDLSRIAVADIVDVQTRLLQDETGAAVLQTMQIISIEENAPGHRIQVVAETFSFIGRFGYVMPDTANDYGSATQTEKDTGCYIVPDTGFFSDDTGPYSIF